MANGYPRYVFTSPGPSRCADGTYDSIVVKDESEHKVALDSGFKDSIPEALEAKDTGEDVAFEVVTTEDKPKRGRPKKEV